MTKRGSSMANLASPRFHRMAHWSTSGATSGQLPSLAASSSSGAAPSLPGLPMEPFGPTNPGQGYSVSVEPTPMPMMDESCTALRVRSRDPPTGGTYPAIRSVHNG